MRIPRFIAILASALIGAQAPAEPADDWRQEPSYTIDVRLDAEAKLLEARQSVDYHNASPDTLTQLVFHLYPNAFRDEESPMRRDHWRHHNGRLADALGDEERGWIDIDSLSVAGSPSEFAVDYTLLRIPLDPPLLPGSSTRVDLVWGGQIRKHSTRSGWRGRQFDMAQWYPKAAVYDAAGWDVDPYRRGEFYGEFGSFRVTIDVPADHVVAATGLPTAGDPGWDDARARFDEESPPERDPDERRSVTFEAEDVHDFAWCASPEFALIDTTFHEIDIHSFIRSSDGHAWRDSVHVYGTRALEWLDRLVGPYPYSQLSLVHGLVSGGMEYPMLVMDGRASEGLVLHEVGHIYFYAILANDETAHAWLDEGFTTWQTTRYLTERYGPAGKREKMSRYDSLLGPEGLWERGRRRHAARLRRGRMEPVDTHSHQFVEAYRDMVYGRASLFLDHLENLLGRETFDRGMRLYYERWALDHVTEDRFRAAMEDASGQPLKAVFDAWVRKIDGIDMAIDDVAVEEEPNGSWRSTVTVERIGDIAVPFELHLRGGKGRVGGDEGDPVVIDGAGEERVVELSVVTRERPDAYILDPRGEFAEVDRRNDRWPRKTSFGIDWPAHHEPAEGAYALRFRPGGWHNDIDGYRVGGNARLGYGGWFDQSLIGAWWSRERERFDLRLRLALPSRRFKGWGRDGAHLFSVENVEGLERWAWRFERWGSDETIYPPHHHFGVGISRETVGDRLAGAEWDLGDTHTFELFYDVSVRPYPFDLGASIGFRRGFESFGGDHGFDRLALGARLGAEVPRSDVRVRLRFFGGLSSERTPAHERFRVGGAGVRARHEAPWLASPGGVPDDLHVRMPGEGNARGYFGSAGDFAAQKMAAVSAEVEGPVPLIGGVVGKALSKPRLFLFVDSASPGGVGVDMAGLGSFDDAGIGIRGSLFGRLPIRLDLPIWLNHPELLGEEDELAARWMVSIAAPWSAPLIRRNP